MAEQKSRTTARSKKSGARKAANAVAEKEPTGVAEDVGGVEEETPDVGGEGNGADVAGGAERTVRDELRSIVREAALEVLAPVARKATTEAAKYAVTKGPKLATNTIAPKVKDTLGPKLQEAGGPGQLAKSVLSSVGGGDAGGLLSKLKPGGGGDVPSGTGRGRRLPIQESIDVAVPLETAYNQYTQFEDFPEFMHRVERVEQKDDTHVMWHENIWGVRRQWEAEITEQRPNERIVWESTSGSPKQKGIVTFHQLSDRLTRIEVTLDQQPKGLFEKTSSGLRMTRRALRSDLMRFKAFIEMREEETGAWRGEIEEGEEPEGREREEPEAEEREEPEGEEEVAEPVADEEEEEEPEEEEEEREEPAAEEEEPEAEEEEEAERKPARRRRQVRRRAPARPARQRR